MRCAYVLTRYGVRSLGLELGWLLLVVCVKVGKEGWMIRWQSANLGLSMIPRSFPGTVHSASASIPYPPPPSPGNPFSIPSLSGSAFC